MQPGIRIDIEFASERGTNLCQEVNHSIAEVGKEEEPPNDRSIQRMTISSPHVKQITTFCPHTLDCFRDSVINAEIMQTMAFSNFGKTWQNHAKPYFTRLGYCKALCTWFCDLTAEICGTLAQHSMDMLRPSPLPNSGLAANPK